MNESEIVIRSATKEDLKAIIEIENKSLSDPWTDTMFVSHFSSNSGITLVAVSDETVCGYINAYVVDGNVNDFDGECEIANVAVDPNYRRMHIAEKLIDSLFLLASDRFCSKFFLEVRDTNLPAQKLYEKNGFVVYGRRKNYYNNPREDAILMMREIK